MEDLLKFLVIAAVIVVGILKEVRKRTPSQKPTGKHPASPLPDPEENRPDAMPLPEAWGSFGPMDDLLQPKPIETSSPEEVAPAPQRKKKKKKKASSTGLSDPCRLSSNETNKPANAAGPLSDVPTSEPEDFHIRSAEEARRAIIWGEILQRKY